MTNILFYLAMGISGLVIVVLCETAHRQSVQQVFVWMREQLFNFLLNWFLMFLAQVFVVQIVGSASIGFLINFAAAYGLAVVSYFKYAARNEPLYASDALLVTKVMSVSDSSNILITNYIVVPVAVAAVAFALLLPFGVDYNLATRLIMIFFTFILFFIMIEEASKEDKHDYTYRIRGFVLGLSINVDLFASGIDVMEFDERKSDVFIKEVESVKQAPPEVTPHVIAILSESFWDITRLQGLELSEDPIPFFRSLQKKCDNGNLVVTPFGGGTCNVEAEFLTGSVVRHFNISNSFYHSYIKKKPVDSLARIFGSLGYDTAALHTFNRDFYNRANAVEKMGFDKFVGLEDIKKPKYEGRYVSDSQLTDMIISEFESGGKPKFIFGISMENHQPYTAGKFSDNTIKVKNADLSPKLAAAAEAYARGIHDADRELKRLVAYFSAKDEPCVLLFFGDHLGALGPELAMFKEFGMVRDSAKLTLEETREIYAPPFIMWSNYKNDHVKYENVGANFLGNILLNYIGFENAKTDFYHLLDRLYQDMHCLSREDLFVDADNKLLSALPAGVKTLEEAYRMYEYNNMGL